MGVMKSVPIVIVSGLSGAGKSTALHALEDLGFFCVDNLPLPLLDRFVDLCAAAGEVERVALVVDARGGEFLQGFREAFRRLRDAGHDLRMVFLDARDEALVRRFSETRRRHPLADEDLFAAIERERGFLRGLREEADAVIDTTTLTPHDLKRAVQDAFGRSVRGLAIAIVSFGYKFGLPADADLVLDVRLLRNPYFAEELRALDGRDERVRAHVLESDDAEGLLERTQALLDYLLPRYEREGKVYLTVGIGCTGGRHRSVVVAEEIARRLTPRCQARVRHRDLGRE
ncbi:MAG: RNase adapter RapZ [Myxococcota bacterium]